MVVTTRKKTIILALEVPPTYDSEQWEAIMVQQIKLFVGSRYPGVRVPDVEMFAGDREQALGTVRALVGGTTNDVTGLNPMA